MNIFATEQGILGATGYAQQRNIDDRLAADMEPMIQDI